MQCLVIEAALTERPMTPDQIIFLSWLTPVFLGACSFMLIRDLPAVRRYLGEVA